MINKNFNKILPLIIPVTFLILWQVSYDQKWFSEEYSRNMSSPYNIAKAGYTLIRDGDFFNHIFISTQRAFGGLFIGGIFGLVLGIINGLSPISEKLFDTPLQMLRNIPHLALVPLVILWFGIEESGKYFLVALGTFFPIYLNTFYGIKSIDLSLVEMAKSYGLKNFTLFREVFLPGALPSILVGLRYSFGIMWLTLIVAETISSNSGLGYLSINAREFLQVDVVFFTVFVYALLGKFADLISKVLENHFLKWNPNYTQKKKNE